MSKIYYKKSPLSIRPDKRLIVFFFFMTVLNVNMFGVIYAYEILSFGFCLYFYKGLDRIYRFKFIFISFFLLILWIYTRRLSSEEAFTWLATYIFLVGTTLGLFLFSRNKSQAMSIIIGVQCGAAISIALFSNDIVFFSGRSPLEKLFITSPSILFFLGVVFRHKGVLLSASLTACAFLVSLSSGDRGQALVYLLVIGSIIIGVRQSSQFVRRTSFAELFAIGAVSLVFAAGASIGIETAAHSGLFSDRMNEKIIRQAEHPLGIVIGARPDTVGMLEAVRQNPLVGYGADGPPPSLSRELVMLNPEYQSLSAIKAESMLDRGLVLHSALLGSWVRFGLLGALPWTFILILAAVSLAKYFANSSGFGILVVYCASEIIFQILFEPGRYRLEIGTNLLILLIANEAKKVSMLVPRREQKGHYAVTR